LEGLMNILVVGDSDVMGEAFRRMGETRKFTCTTAKTGEVPISKAKKESLDLILLHVVLPGIDGVEVYKRIKKM